MVAHSKKYFFIFQQKYVTNLLNEIEKRGCKPPVTPIELNHKLGEEINGMMVDRAIVSKTCW